MVEAVQAYIEPDDDVAPDFVTYLGALRKQTKSILQILALIKHEAFSEEKEWRLVSQYYDHLDNAEFRPGASMLTPHLKWKLLNNEWLFDAIILEPTPHPALALASLKAMVKKNRLSEKVVASDIPYRVW